MVGWLASFFGAMAGFRPAQPKRLLPPSRSSPLRRGMAGQAAVLFGATTASGVVKKPKKANKCH